MESKRFEYHVGGGSSVGDASGSASTSIRPW
jgi:hypothetical protein